MVHKIIIYSGKLIAIALNQNEKEDNNCFCLDFLNIGYIAHANINIKSDFAMLQRIWFTHFLLTFNNQLLSKVR